MHALKKVLFLGIFSLFCTTSYAGNISLGTISADATVAGFNSNLTTIANVINGNIEGSTDSGASVSNIKADSVFEINMADDANGRVRDSELFNITVDTISGGAVASQGTVVESGCVQATDTDLTADVSACVAYINGYRVSKSATSQTYANNTTTYLWLSQTGSYTQSTNPNSSVANSALLASVVTSGGQITTVSNLFTTRVPGLIIPSNYREGLRVSRDSTTTLTVFPGACEVNSSIVTKSSTTTLTLTTAGDWAGGSSLQATSTAGYVGIDASGNLKLHTTAPTHQNYAVSVTLGKKRYATWSATVYRILGWFYMNATGSGELNSYEVGNIKEGDVPNAVNLNDLSTRGSLTSTTYADITNTTLRFYSSGGPVLSVLTVSGDVSSTGATIDIAQNKNGSRISGATNSGFTDDNNRSTTVPSFFIETTSQGLQTYKGQYKVDGNTLAIRGTNYTISEQ